MSAELETTKLKRVERVRDPFQRPPYSILLISIGLGGLGLLTVLSGCAPKAWVIKSPTPTEEGVIGYSLDLSLEEKTRVIQNRILCDHYTPVADSVKPAGPREIDVIPVTTQPTGRTAGSLGSQSSFAETPETETHSGVGPSQPTVREESPLDGAYGEFRYRCEPTSPSGAMPPSPAFSSGTQ